MHQLVHLVLILLLISAVSVLFTLFIVCRPGANQPVSRKKLLVCLVVGVVIAGVFLMTGSLYATEPPV
ncbi:MAG: hypothetical protein IRZ33_04595 [Alicyclobacillaceae bacterium]|nr:hypothetical protein [Alicyclobacillaceae bacterium]